LFLGIDVKFNDYALIVILIDGKLKEGKLAG